jgi:hypothetical protein
MMTRRNAAQAASRTPQAPSYQGLLRAAEAHPDEFFTIAGDKLARLIRELEGSRPRRRVTDA